MTPETKLTAEQLAQGRSLYDAMFAHVNAPESDYKPYEKAWECWLFDHGYQLMTASERDSKGSLMTPETKDRLVKLVAKLKDEAAEYPVGRRDAAQTKLQCAERLSSIVAQMDETPAPAPAENSALICMNCDGTGWCEGSPAWKCEACKGTGNLPVAPADAPATERDLYDDLSDALDKVRTIPAAVPAPPVAQHQCHGLDDLLPKPPTADPYRCPYCGGHGYGMLTRAEHEAQCEKRPVALPTERVHELIAFYGTLMRLAADRIVEVEKAIRAHALKERRNEV